MTLYDVVEALLGDSTLDEHTLLRLRMLLKEDEEEQAWLKSMEQEVHGPAGQD